MDKRGGFIAKVGALLAAEEFERCFVSRARATVIDVINPATGRTAIYGKDLPTVRTEYPDAEEMSLDDFCAWKAAQQRTPITWEPTTEAHYWDALGAVYPAAIIGTAFLLGEPYDHDAGNGQPRFQAYRRKGRRYESSNRPMTKEEFRSCVAAD